MSHSKITIYNLTMTLAATEYSQVLPSFFTKVEIKCRDTSDLQLAFTSGQSGTTYTLIPGGSSKILKSDNGTGFAGVWTLYLQSPTAGAIAEIEAYT